MESTLGFRACIFVLSASLLLPFSITKADDVISTVMAGSSRIDVTMDASKAPLPQADVVKWIQSAAESVTAYYGHFPVPHVTLRVVSFEGSGVRHGTTWGRDGGLIRISVGSKTSPAEFADDWTLTHEMIHLAFPSMMNEDHHWIEEGLSVYVEPIARIRARHWTASQMWHDLVRDMPKGEPQQGDAGMDNTHTWGRTYWGGALFCFVADLQIRKQTQNRKGLEDALRGILDAGGTINEDWSIEKAFKIGDQAVGLNVLETLYAEWKDKPMPVDLGAMWQQLGVESNDGIVTLNDNAPLSAIRRAIEMGTPASKASHPDRSADSSFQGDSIAATRPPTVFAGRTARSN